MGASRCRILRCRNACRPTLRSNNRRRNRATRLRPKFTRPNLRRDFGRTAGLLVPNQAAFVNPLNSSKYFRVKFKLNTKIRLWWAVCTEADLLARAQEVRLAVRTITLFLRPWFPQIVVRIPDSRANHGIMVREMNESPGRALALAGESETVEFKRSTGELSRGGQSLCAFMNGGFAIAILRYFVKQQLQRCKRYFWGGSLPTTEGTCFARHSTVR